MQTQRILHQKASLNFVRKINLHINLAKFRVFDNMFLSRSITDPCQLKTVLQRRDGNPLATTKDFSAHRLSKIKCMLDEKDILIEEDELCPVECVREFYTEEEFSRILEKAKESNALVVVDFYRTSCGSCKYIEQGFAKLCKGAGDQQAPVIFLKHNVLDEYDEQSEVAERLRIRSVPLFHFYKNGVLLEAFPTRDKERILDAILKYTAASSPSQEVESTS